jgi:hypothetical protein
MASGSLSLSGERLSAIKAELLNKLRGLSPRANYTDEQPPLVGELCVNVYGERVPLGQRDGSLRPYSRPSRPDPLLLRKSGSAGNRTRTSGSVVRNCEH